MSPSRRRQRGFLLNPARFGVVAAVNVLTHLDGTDGSTTFVEENGKTITRVGTTIAIRTAQSKFGGASAGPFGAGRLTVPHAGMAAGVDFTLLAWFYWDGTAAGNKAILTTAGNSEIYLRSGSSNGLTIFSSGTNQVIGSAPSANAWHLACLERVGSTLRLTLDGVSQGTFTDAGAFAGGTLTIGSYSDGTEPFQGYIDEVYLRIGSAQFGGGAFTPPTSAMTL